MVNQLVNYQDPRMDALFAALADPIRRGMITRLSAGPATVGELGRPWPITKPAVTKHLRVLERAGLVSRTREGRVHRCSLNPDRLAQAETWIERQRLFWEGSLDRLSQYVSHTQPPRTDR